jgi:hypothetical protein
METTNEKTIKEILAYMLNTPDKDPKSYFWLKKYFENNCDVQAKTHKIYVMAMLQRRYKAIYPESS